MLLTLKMTLLLHEQLEKFEIAADACQRRAQFVIDVKNELVFELVQLALLLVGCGHLPFSLLCFLARPLLGFQQVAQRDQGIALNKEDHEGADKGYDIDQGPHLGSKSHDVTGYLDSHAAKIAGTGARLSQEP